MRIGALSNSIYNPAWAYAQYTPASLGASSAAASPLGGVSGVTGEAAVASAKPGKVNPAECETCKNRKYQDGSNENVSFKAASHISPEQAGTAVRAHEGEHVANAYEKAAKDGGKVLQASVKLNTAICPECGRSYVSGGLTTTKIQYSNQDNPYQKAKKAQDADAVAGMNVDKAV